MSKIIKMKWTKNYYVALTGVLLILTYIVFTVQAESNDDPGIMQYISGFLTGKTDVLPYLMGVPYTYIISRLYRLTTSIPWYGLAFVLINTGAVLIICDRFMKKNCTIQNYGCFLCFYASFFLYQLTNVQFTTVAGLSGLAAIMVVYDACIEEKIKASDIALVVMFSFFSYNIRGECGLVVLGVIIYIVLGNVILLKERNKNQIICFFSCMGVIAISILCNTIYVNSTDWKEFVELAHERARFMDYEKMKYDDAEDMYLSVGWDQDVYNLRMFWCFMDDSANLETFSTLNVENEKRIADKGSIGQKVRELLSRVEEFTRVLRWQSIILAGWTLWIIADFIYIIHKKDLETTRKFLYALGFYMMVAVMVLFFLIRGRYNDRAVIMVLSCGLIPGFRSLSINSNCIYEGNKKLTTILVCGLIVLAASGLYKQKWRTIYSYEKWNNIYKYVLEHKECIYVGDGSMSSTNNLFQTFIKEENAANYAFWGGWLADSPLYMNHLEANGVQHLNLEDMLDDNRFFIGDSDYYIDLLRTYYNNRYSNVEEVIYYEADDFMVYGFRRLNKE